MYIKVKNGKPVNYSVEQLRRDNSNISFPAELNERALADYNVFYLNEVDKPKFDPSKEEIVELEPINSNGKWFQAWGVKKLSTEQSNEYFIKISKEISTSLQQLLDHFAKTRGYDSMVSACSYKDSLVKKFATEAKHCIFIRDSAWSKFEEIMADAKAKKRPLPKNLEEIQKEMPSLTWPE
jgi:hypothetical protein